MPHINIITPPWQNRESIDGGDSSSSIIDGVFTDLGGLTGRPGHMLFKQITNNSSVCQGIFWWEYKDILLVVFAGKLYAGTCADSALTFTHVNASANLGSGQCTFAANRYWIYIASGSQILRWNGNTGTAATFDPLASAIGLTTSSHLAYIESDIIANKTGTQSWYYAEPDPSDATNPLIWGATGLSAPGSPDDIKAIATGWREAMIVGSESTEWWYMSGDSAVFRRTEGAFAEVGTLSPNSVVKADNTFFFLSEKKEVIQLSGRTPKVLSLAIKKELDNIRVVTDAIGFLLDQRYVLTFPTANITWVYDLVRQTWYRWGAWNSDLHQYNAYPGRCAAFASKFGVWFIGGINGSLYLYDRSLRTDSGSLIRTEFISKPMDHGTLDYKFCHRLSVKLKRGSNWDDGTLGRFVEIIRRGIEINYLAETYYQWEPIKILGSFDWTYDWSPLPTGLTFDTTTRVLSGTASSTTVVNSVLTLTNTSSGLVLQFPITLRPGIAVSTLNLKKVRSIELYFRDENQEWSTAIEIPAGEIGDTYSLRHLAGMGRYSTREYKIVFPSAIDVALADMSERVSGES